MQWQMAIWVQLTYLLTVTLINTQIHHLTNVRMEVISKRGKSPLNPTNFRVDKQRHPQYSVQVQKKWNRSDYVFPGSRVINNG